MIKKIKISLLLLAAGALVHADAFDPNSHTFLTIRPPFQESSPEKLAGWRDRPLTRDCGWGGAFQIVPFGGRSTRSSDIGQYFMFCNKSSLVVAEDLAVGSANPNGLGNPNFRDVNAIHFNIQTVGTNFKSTIEFAPRHSFAGVGLDWKQYLHGRDACEKKWWLEISTPIMYVRNDVRLTEIITTTGTPVSTNVNANMVEAFKGQKGFFRKAGVGGENPQTALVTGSVWQFGKIDGSQKRTRAADVEVKIGYDYLCTECCHAEGYIGGVIPAGNKPKYEYVFEPIVGHNFHGGVMWGAAWGWELWSSCDRYLHMEMATNGRYSFRNTQVRAMDVKFKPWSRYQLVYRSFADAVSSAPQDGINVFTRKVKVNPRYSKDINAAVVYTSGGFQGELGYNFWARATEKVSLDQPFESGVTFASVGQGSTAGIFASGFPNRAITIKENFQDTGQDVMGDQALYNRLALTEADLNFYSAATPCAITNTFYASLGYRWDDWCYPVSVNFGGSYELATERSAINRWIVWGKFIVSI